MRSSEADRGPAVRGDRKRFALCVLPAASLESAEGVDGILLEEDSPTLVQRLVMPQAALWRDALC